MKMAAVVLIVLVAAVLINAVRGGEGFPLVEVLPGMTSGRPGLYHLAGVAMLVIAGWGLLRMRRSGREDD